MNTVINEVINEVINKREIIGIIPARYSSVRLQAKPLVNICGIPMIVKVWQNVSQSKMMKNVTVATDDQRIVEVCDKYEIPSVMTATELQSGTDRVFAAYKKLGETAEIETNEIIVNIQGDEPLLSSDDIDIMLSQFLLSNADVGTLITKINNSDDLFSPNSVKVALDAKKNALYFSRSPIPYLRDVPQELWLDNATFWKHIGIYAYKINALEKFVNLPKSIYETTEKLEQLRLLEQNVSFFCAETNSKLIGVDTQQDLDNVINILSN